MFKNYLKIALRNLSKHKSYSFINIAGLAIGLACFLLIALFINYELSYDRWNPNADRIVRPYSDIKFGGNEMLMAVTGAVIGPDIAKEIPEVQTFCRFRDYGNSLVKREGELQQNFDEQEILTVDSTFFELFPVELLAGDAKTCLTEPNTIAISETKAEKYFGSTQMAIGEVLILDNQRNYRVTGVYKELPSNSHFQAHFLIAMNGNREVQNSPPLWAANNNFHTYILLRKHTDYELFADKFAQLSRRKVEETSRQLMNLSLEEFEATGQHARFHLQKMPDIHLYSAIDVELSPNGSIQYIWIFGAIALFILLIACINFMNLSTARSSHRSKEIGVRKVLGSLRISLIRQFLSETFVMTFIAVVMAIGLAAFTLPWFSTLASREMAMPWGNLTFWLSIITGTAVVSLLAGSYPAFFLSRFEAIKVLKGQMNKKAGGANLRSALVVFQFVTSIVLIIGTILVYNQLNYIQNKKLGFQKDQVLIVDNAYALGSQVEVFKDQALQHSAIKSATVSSYLPVPSSRSNTTFTTSKELRQDNAINMQVWTVDHDYMETVGIEMEEGRFFDQSFLTDSTAVILNERAVEILGFEQPMGKRIYTLQNFSGNPAPEDFVELTVVGVVKNFHWESLRENIGPLCMTLGNSTGLISFKVDAAESQVIMGHLESNWKQLSPEQPFSARFMDNAFTLMYESEQRIGRIAMAFALLAIFISCLGLFGLASFTAEQRTKEIGIRKVLGANVGNIVGLLSKEFLKLVLIALVIAIPIAWWTMNKWVQDFAYHTDISWTVFAAAGIAAILIAILSVSFQSIKAGLANPLDSLRSE